MFILNQHGVIISPLCTVDCSKLVNCKLLHKIESTDSRRMFFVKLNSGKVSPEFYDANNEEDFYEFINNKRFT